jgi:hypothetical protein
MIDRAENGQGRKKKEEENRMWKLGVPILGNKQ